MEDWEVSALLFFCCRAETASGGGGLEVQILLERSGTACVGSPDLWWRSGVVVVDGDVLSGRRG